MVLIFVRTGPDVIADEIRWAVLVGDGNLANIFDLHFSLPNVFVILLVV